MRPSRLKQISLALCVGLATGISHAQDAASDQNAQQGADQGVAQSNEQGRLPLDDLRTFTRVFEDIRSGYIEEVDDATLFEYAIKGMLSELDPHSTFLDASNFDNLKENTTGQYGGLGIEVGMEDGFVKVISPMDDTPASTAGIEAGDLIVQIDGKSIKGKSLAEAIELMRGEKGSKITLKVMRDGLEKPKDIEIIRDYIKVTSVRSRLLDDHYGLIRIAQFQIPTGKDFVKAIEKLKSEAEPLKGLIIDLRNNPGGVLRASVQVADALMDGGQVVYTEGRIKGANAEFNAEPGDITDGMPVIVLINGGSASASEIVAGALQDHDRAVILGTRSFGKGSVQSVIPISKEKAIKLTTSLYFTPNGRSIQAQGIEPDIEVERARLTAIKPRARITEADLSGHLGNANGGEESGAAERKRRQDNGRKLLERDNQLYEALNILKGLSLLSKK
ncbi:S41 family peptidase [Pseudoteredinibacter isoporae]|uniref:Carboxyl-terminal processing protease n=1 Tax=Pseudoteredinibacter isoporae TaxID=570281 RepID=A0A7X0JPE2_9GAMM|nr:S41 family peptidase [Pseudoteredinibacter isoporae]MBB6519868.1 carboxyl-terminal processing protease [Pseudoteredinibacter isoporae]NHO85446.1 S41 family peptidase [Pseudoteredinibacter isoporae]NIB26102.1 S41 family peptidase [Pseudoteredinibacter isoporae]